MNNRFDIHREFFGVLGCREKNNNFSTCRERIDTMPLEKAMQALQEKIAKGELDLDQFGGGKFRAQVMKTAVECMLLIYSLDDALS